eukprot:m.1364593 g.1364593  ORF g.1364593 m.1364593 type:complete len:1064 (-) comp24946_c0_seq62:2896-6087(-)
MRQMSSIPAMAFCGAEAKQCGKGKGTDGQMLIVAAVMCGFFSSATGTISVSTTSVDPCRSSPCLNGGICIDNRFGTATTSNVPVHSVGPTPGLSTELPSTIIGATTSAGSSPVPVGTPTPVSTFSASSISTEVQVTLPSATSSPVTATFYCDCSGTGFEGDYCEIETTTSVRSSTSAVLTFTSLEESTTTHIGLASTQTSSSVAPIDTTVASTSAEMTSVRTTSAYDGSGDSGDYGESGDSGGSVDSGVSGDSGDSGDSSYSGDSGDSGGDSGDSGISSPSTSSAAAATTTSVVSAATTPTGHGTSSTTAAVDRTTSITARTTSATARTTSVVSAATTSTGHDTSSTTAISITTAATASTTSIVSAATTSMGHDTASTTTTVGRTTSAVRAGFSGVVSEHSYEVEMPLTLTDLSPADLQWLFDFFSGLFPGVIGGEFRSGSVIIRLFFSDAASLAQARTDCAAIEVRDADGNIVPHQCEIIPDGSGDSGDGSGDSGDSGDSGSDSGSGSAAEEDTTTTGAVTTTGAILPVTTTVTTTATATVNPVTATESTSAGTTTVEISTTNAPTDMPTDRPTDSPSDTPSEAPTDVPTVEPTSSPSSQTAAPTTVPTAAPTGVAPPIAVVTTTTTTAAPTTDEGGGVIVPSESDSSATTWRAVAITLILLMLLVVLILILIVRKRRKQGTADLANQHDATDNIMRLEAGPALGAEPGNSADIIRPTSDDPRSITSRFGSSDGGVKPISFTTDPAVGSSLAVETAHDEDREPTPVAAWPADGKTLDSSPPSRIAVQPAADAEYVPDDDADVMSPSPMRADQRAAVHEIAETDLDAIEPDFGFSRGSVIMDNFGPDSTILALSPPNSSWLEETALDDSPSEHSDTASVSSKGSTGSVADVLPGTVLRSERPLDEQHPQVAAAADGVWHPQNTTAADATPPENEMTSPLSPRKLYGPMFSATEGLNSAIGKALNALEEARGLTPSPVRGRSPGATAASHAPVAPPPPAFDPSTLRAPAEPLYDVPEGASPVEYPDVVLPGAVLQDGDAMAPEVDLDDFSFADMSADGARHALV